MDACYSINRKKKYVTIYNNQTRYPLELWNELRAQHGMTHQEQANAMLEIEQKEKTS